MGERFILVGLFMQIRFGVDSCSIIIRVAFSLPSTGGRGGHVPRREIFALISSQVKGGERTLPAFVDS